MANSLIPYSFVPGTKAMASEVNANFLALADSVEAGKQYTNEAIENFNTEFESKLEEYEGIVAEKMAPNMSNSLNISNCIIEKPQRIKYTLADGKLTIKAGSVVIVPYGTQDLRQQYPKGARFLNDKFKVYDTQFTSNGFFVWAELQQDSVNTSTTSTDTERQLYLYMDGTIGAMVRMESGTSNTSASTYTSYYNTATNKIGIATSTTSISYSNVVSFPFMRIQGNSNTFWGEVLQVFNGIGYIGNTLWIDKGVKVLTPDGLNADGTYKNILHTTNSAVFYSFPSTASYTRDKQPFMLYNGSSLSCNIANNRYYESYTNPDRKSTYVSWLNLEDNTLYHADGTAGVFVKHNACLLGYISTELGKIKSFSPRPVFKAADINEVHRLIKSFNTSSKASRGYIKLGDGIIIQWGRETSSLTTNPKTITYPTAFSSSTSYAVTANDSTSSTSQSHCGVNTPTATSFVLYHSTDANVITWIAIGY